MKNQYFGDVGDYGKYSLLRAFAKEGVRVGVNWYLTENDGSADGRHTNYLHDEREERYDPELFACLKRMVNSGQRDVKQFEAQNMIPGAMYYHDLLDISRFETLKEKRKERARWHAGAMDALQDSELVFLDPDNGIRAQRSARKDSVKYAFADEAAEYYERGQNIVYYCHKGRRTESQWEETKHILRRYTPSSYFSGVTLHRGTQRTFLFAIHREDYKRYDQILTDFLESVWSEAFSLEPINNRDRMPGTGFAAPVIGTIIPRDWIKIKNPDGTIRYVSPEDFEREQMKKEE